MPAVVIALMGLCVSFIVAPVADEKFNSNLEKWSRVLIVVGATVVLLLLTK